MRRARSREWRGAINRTRRSNFENFLARYELAVALEIEPYAPCADSPTAEAPLSNICSIFRDFRTRVRLLINKQKKSEQVFRTQVRPGAPEGGPLKIKGPLEVVRARLLIAEPKQNPREKRNHDYKNNHQPIYHSKFIIKETTEKSTAKPSKKNNNECNRHFVNLLCFSLL